MYTFGSSGTWDFEIRVQKADFCGECARFHCTVWSTDELSVPVLMLCLSSLSFFRFVFAERMQMPVRFGYPDMFLFECLNKRASRQYELV